MLALVAGVMLLLGSATTALAHAEFKDSDPEDGAVLDTAPTAISVTFTEGVVAAKSSIVLVGPDGEIGSAAPAADDDDRIRLGGLTLLPGAYTIRWTAAADDGHIERGTVGFAINEPAASPAPPTPVATAAPESPAASLQPSTGPSPAGTSSPVASPAPSGDSGTPAASGGDVLLPIVAALALVAVVGVLVLRRNRTA